MRTMRSLLLCLLVAAAWSSLATGQRSPSGAVLFEGARLIVGDGSQAVENAAFLVENDRFTRVGRKGEIQPPAGAARVDLTGKTVMPTIINGHGHLGYVNLSVGTEEKWENYTHENLVTVMQRYAYYGVGAALSMGNDGGHGELPWTFQNEVIPNTARFLTTGPGISSPGGGQSGVRAKSWTTVTTEAEARKAIQDLAPHKPSLVKIWVDDRNNTVPPMSPALYGAVIDEAHKHNLRVIAHLVRLKDAKGLTKANVDGFAHVVRDLDGPQVDDELIQMLKQHPGIFMMPLLTDPPDRQGGYTVEDLPWIAESLPPSQVNRMREALAKRKPNPNGAKGWQVLSGNMSKLHKAGAVRMALGTDGDIPWAPHFEMADMVAAGLTPSEAIVAGTKTVAEVIGLKDVGTVASGKSADFMVLDANPLENINNTRRIAKVYLRGKEVDRAALRKKLTAEAGASGSGQ